MSIEEKNDYLKLHQEHEALKGYYANVNQKLKVIEYGQEQEPKRHDQHGAVQSG